MERNSIPAQQQCKYFAVMRKREHVEGLKEVETVVGVEQLKISPERDGIAAGVKQQARFQCLDQCHAGGVQTSARWVADDRVEVVCGEFIGPELIETPTTKLCVVTMIAASGLVGTGDGVARNIDAGDGACVCAGCQ